MGLHDTRESIDKQQEETSFAEFSRGFGNNDIGEYNPVYVEDTREYLYQHNADLKDSDSFFYCTSQSCIGHALFQTEVCPN